MCGIFGWSFKRRARIPAAQREALAATLAVANSYRGDQSWGVAYFDQGGKRRVRKQVGDIAHVLGISALGAQDTLMAHTRYATTGRVSKDNQHPFQVGEILLAHNGMVFNHDDLDTKYGRHCEVDSQHFAHHLSAGVPFSDIEAYGAIEWFEGTSRTVNLCRMREGQLAIYGIKNHKGQEVGVVWSSDVVHLRSAVGAARLDAFPFVKPEEGHVYLVSSGKLYHSERRLECSEPMFDPRKWSRYRSTQGSTCTTEGTRTVYSFRGEDDEEGDGQTSALVQAWLARKAREEKEAAEAAAAARGTLIEVDQGLFVDEAGNLTDNLTRSEDEPAGAPACDTCGSLEGFSDFGACRECGTIADGAHRMASMTDEEWSAYERLQAG